MTAAAAPLQAETHNAKVYEASECKFISFPTQRSLRNFRLKTKKTIASASTKPNLAYQWICKAERALSLEELEDDEGFETLSAKAATGFLNIVHGEFARQIENYEEELSKKEKMLNGRQMAFLVYEHYRISEVEGSILEFRDLLKVELLIIFCLFLTSLHAEV